MLPPVCSFLELLDIQWQKTAKFTPNFTDWQNWDSFTYLQWTQNMLECTPDAEEIYPVFKTARRDGNVKGRNVIRGTWAEWVWDKPYEQWDLLVCRTEFWEKLSHAHEKFKTIPKPPRREHSVRPWLMDRNPLEWRFPVAGMRENYFVDYVMWGYRLCKDGGALTE